MAALAAGTDGESRLAAPQWRCGCPERAMTAEAGLLVVVSGLQDDEVVAVNQVDQAVLFADTP